MSKFVFNDDQTEFLKEAIAETRRRVPEGYYTLFVLECLLGLNPSKVTPDVQAWADEAIKKYEESKV